jgi:hypothetical protein
MLMDSSESSDYNTKMTHNRLPAKLVAFVAEAADHRSTRFRFHDAANKSWIGFGKRGAFMARMWMDKVRSLKINRCQFNTTLIMQGQFAKRAAEKRHVIILKGRK